MPHRGSCHCGRIAFEVEGEIASAVSCNCSICRRKGVLMWFVPRAALRLLTPEADVGRYAFASGSIGHRFCSHCGIHPFNEATSPAGDAMAAINLRCIDGLDLSTVPVEAFDGRSL
jgi:hypothetical protein